MVEFNLWRETFIFGVIFAPMVIIPCILVTMIGRKMIDRLGMYPTQTPIIQMGIFWKLVAIEVSTFVSLYIFLQFFSAK